MTIQDQEITFTSPVALAQLRRLFPNAIDDSEHKEDIDCDIMFSLHGLSFSLLTTAHFEKVIGLFNCDGGNQFSETEVEDHQLSMESVLQDLKKHNLIA
jgi:hypothetical protein